LNTIKHHTDKMGTFIHKYNKLKELKTACIDLLDEIVSMYGNDDILRDARFGREWFQIVARMEEVVDIMSAGNILMTRMDNLMSQNAECCYSTIAVLLRRYNNNKQAVFAEYLDWVVINPSWDQLDELLQLQLDINTKAVNLIQYVNETG